MTTKEFQFGIRITADGKGAVVETGKVEKAVADVGDAATRASRQATEAFKETTASATAAKQSIDYTALSAKQMQFALRGVPAQVTDIVTGLASGQAPLTVLIQQGGQLKDMFGGIGPAARAIGGYVAGLLTPTNVAVAATAGLAVAYYQGAKEAESLNKAIITSGNAAGVTTSQLQDMAAAAASATGATRGAASTITAELTAGGQVAAETIQRATQATIALERAGVQAASETVKQFSELGKTPVEASLKLNEQYRYLTFELFRQIKAYEDQGQAADAAALAQKAFADASADMAQRVEANLSGIEKAWRGLGDLVKFVGDTMASVGRDASLAERIAQLEQKGAAGRGIFSGRNEDDEKELALLKAMAQAQQEAADKAKEKAAADRAGVELINESYKHLSKAEQKQREINQAVERYRISVAGAAGDQKKMADLGAAYEKTIAGINDKYKEKGGKSQAVKDAEALASLLDKINGKSAGLDPTYWKELETLHKAYASGKLTLEEYQDKVGKLTTQQQFHKETLKAEADAQKAAEKAAADYSRAVDAQLRPLEDQAAKLEQEIEFYGMSEAAIQQTIVARLEEAKTIAAANGAWPEHLNYLQREIDARKRIATAAGSKEVLDAGKKAAEESARAWEKTSDEINRVLTDSLMRGFESGKGFAQNFRDAVANLFKTLVLRPIVQLIVQPVAGQVAGVMNQALGMPGANGVSTLSLASAGNSAYSVLNNGVGSTTGTYVSAVGNLFGSAATSAYGAGMGLTGAQAAAAAAQYEAAAGAAAAAGDMASAATYSQVAQSLQAGSTAGAAAGMIGGVAAGYTLGTLISGGRGVLGNGSSAAVGTGTAIGAFFGPVGAMVGGVIGGLVNAAFGSGPKKVTGAGLQGEFTAAGFEGVNYQDWRKKGGWFSGGGSGTNTSGLSAEQQAFYNAAVAGMASPYLALQASAGGAPLTDRMGAFSYSVRRNIGSEADITALLKDVSNALGEQLLPELENFRQKDEALADTAARLGNVFSATNTLADILGQDLEDAFGSLGIASAGVRQSLVDAAGGLDAFKAGVQSYYQDYYSQEEQLTRSRQAVAQQLAAVGLEMPSSKAAFRALVESLDKTTITGQRAFTVMMQVEHAFAEITDAAAGAGAAVGSLADQVARTQEAAAAAIEAQAGAAEDAARNARQAAESYRQASAAIADAIVQLRGGDLSPLSPQQKLAEQDQRLSALFAQAQAGDLAALGKLSGAAGDYLNASRAYNASGSAYAADFDRVMGLLQQAGAVSDAGALKSDYQGTLLELQVEALKEIQAQLASPSPDAAILAEQKALLDAIGEALRSQNSLTLTGNATNDAIRYLTGANNNLTEEMLRSLVGGASIQTQTLENLLSGSDQAVDLLQQLVDLSAAKAAQDAAAQAADEQARAEAAAVLKATAAYESQKAIADALRATWDQTVAAFGVRQDGGYTAEDIAAGRAASYGYYTYYTGEDYKVDSAREANAAYLAAFQKAYELYKAIPGHATGLEWVPYDNYTARLHEGEAVVDAGAMAAIRRYFGVTPRAAAPADNGKTLAESRRQTGYLEALIRQQGAGLQALLEEMAGMREELKILRKSTRRQEASA